MLNKLILLPFIVLSLALMGCDSDSSSPENPPQTPSAEKDTDDGSDNTETTDPVDPAPDADDEDAVLVPDPNPGSGGDNAENPTQPAPGNGGETPADPNDGGEGETPDAEQPEEEPFGMTEDEVRQVIEGVYSFLPEGVYKGKLEAGAPCEVTVAPATESFKDLKITLKAEAGRGVPAGTLDFKLDSNLPIEVILIEETEFRVSLETAQEKPNFGGDPSYNFVHLSSTLDAEGKATGLYIFDQARMERGLANATCNFESYEPLPVEEEETPEAPEEGETAE